MAGLVRWDSGAKVICPRCQTRKCLEHWAHMASRQLAIDLSRWTVLPFHRSQGRTQRQFTDISGLKPGHVSNCHNSPLKVDSPFGMCASKLVTDFEIYICMLYIVSIMVPHENLRIWCVKWIYVLAEWNVMYWNSNPHNHYLVIWLLS